MSKVNCGEMKKKFQITALKKADKSTGRISKSMAIIETVNNKISAVAL